MSMYVAALRRRPVARISQGSSERRQSATRGALGGLVIRVFWMFGIFR